MAGGQERVLRRRIRSVQSTKKITKAMELIAASQIVRAQARIAQNRGYREGMARIVRATARADPRVAEKLLGTPESPSSIGVVTVVGDRGLAGAYNSSVFRGTERLISEHARAGRRVRLFTVGKKAPGYFRFRGFEVQQSFAGFADRPSYADARHSAAPAIAAFLEGEVDILYLVSTRYLSAGVQRVETVQLLPFPMPEDPAAGSGEPAEEPKAQSREGGGGYLEFEPDPESLLLALVVQSVESEIFSALLEATAAFFTSQQRAMAAATENADELIRTLSRIMNRARQDALTTEIMEIVGGAEALRQSKGA
jgi:F-type H+-transporting ATPase subunit gamma